MHSYTQYL